MIVNEETVNALRIAYEQAIEKGNDEFTFQNQQMLVGYAKYLLEYLEERNGS